MGGMTKAIEAGMPKLRIEETAARRAGARSIAARTSSSASTSSSLAEEPEIDTREIDNTRRARVAGRAAQAASRRRATPAPCQQALDALTAVRRERRRATCSALAVEAARARATVGEISSALEKVWGRYHAEIRSISGVYGASVQRRRRVEGAAGRGRSAFAAEHGRRPRMLVAKIGQDGHDRGAKVIATAFADLGFDVDVGTLFQTPEEVARQAVENDVHVVGVSTQSGGHKTLVPQLIAGAREARRRRHRRHRRRHRPAEGLRDARAGGREGRVSGRARTSPRPPGASSAHHAAGEREGRARSA